MGGFLLLDPELSRGRRAPAGHKGRVAAASDGAFVFAVESADPTQGGEPGTYSGYFWPEWPEGGRRRGRRRRASFPEGTSACATAGTDADASAHTAAATYLHPGGPGPSAVAGDCVRPGSWLGGEEPRGPFRRAWQTQFDAERNRATHLPIARRVRRFDRAARRLVGGQLHAARLEDRNDRGVSPTNFWTHEPIRQGTKYGRPDQRDRGRRARHAASV